MKLLILSALAASALAAPTTSPSSTKYLISFGNSYTATSFDITGEKPSPANPLGNPPFPGWSSSGGANWIANLVSKYNDSLLLSYNLAYGGATVNATLVPPYTPEVLSLIDQVALFDQHLSPPPSYAPWTADNTLFAVWQGINDVGNGWYQPEPEALAREIMTQLFEQLELVYSGGARNFAFLTVPPTDRSPMITQGENAEYTITHLGAAIENWNTMLNDHVAAFASAHPDVLVKVTDTQPVFHEILDSDEEAANCWHEDGVTCLWFDDYHPGLVIQEAVAREVAAAWGDFFIDPESV
ncbi:hypothetical protein BJX61DRAFT_531263 [Aspergillus egyptiacus]|nr:hypothetical protein BJX61DRAFT_531263 [Aspergillus egyptiacus]